MTVSRFIKSINRQLTHFRLYSTNRIYPKSPIHIKQQVKARLPRTITTRTELNALRFCEDKLIESYIESDPAKL
jgi:hypothetical protein